MDNKGFKIYKLPVYQNNVPEGEEVISRIFTKKGELAILAVDEINFLAHCDFIKGREPRGNHYHKHKIEYLYICRGKVKVYIKKTHDDSAKIDIFEVDGGTMIYIEPKYSHAIEALEDGYGFEFSPTKYNIVKKDTYYDKIIF